MTILIIHRTILNCCLYLVWNFLIHFYLILISFQMLFSEHRWFNICGGQQWQRKNSGGKGRIEQDVGRGRTEGRRGAGVCQQAGLATSHEPCRDYRQVGFAQHEEQKLVHSGENQLVKEKKNLQVHSGHCTVNLWAPIDEYLVSCTCTIWIVPS